MPRLQHPSKSFKTKILNKDLKNNNKHARVVVVLKKSGELNFFFPLKNQNESDPHEKTKGRY